MLRHPFLTSSGEYGQSLVHSRGSRFKVDQWRCCVVQKTSSPIKGLIHSPHSHTTSSSFLQDRKRCGKRRMVSTNEYLVFPRQTSTLSILSNVGEVRLRFCLVALTEQTLSRNQHNRDFRYCYVLVNLPVVEIGPRWDC